VWGNEVTRELTLKRINFGRSVQNQAKKKRNIGCLDKKTRRRQPKGFGIQMSQEQRQERVVTIPKQEKKKGEGQSRANGFNFLTMPHLLRRRDRQRGGGGTDPS